MKAWHIQDKGAEYQEIVFADTRGKAIIKSEAIDWNDFTSIRAVRAKYADNLENDRESLLQAQLDKG